MASIKVAILVLLLSAGVLLTAGDILMKEWVIHHKPLWYAGGFALYIVSLVGLSFTYKYENIAVASATLVIFNIITLSLVSWLYFHEPLSIKQWVGIALGIAAVALID
jgi:multidrug transporter EmrE-like cation transporter